MAEDIIVSEWAWIDDNAHSVPRTQADFQLWQVHNAKGEHLGFLALPVDVNATRALMVAKAGYSVLEHGHG